MEMDTEAMAAPLRSQPFSVLYRRSENLENLYVVGRKLGQGQFGTTYLCTEKSTGREYACKSIEKRKLICEEDIEDVRREIRIMHHLCGHPNIVALKEAYEDAAHVHLVMELCEGGELFDRIIQKGHYSERKAAELIRTIVGVVQACHSFGIMHRDLKPENFLFSNNNEDSPLKAIDFGLSVFFKPGTKCFLHFFLTFFWYLDGNSPPLRDRGSSLRLTVTWAGGEGTQPGTSQLEGRSPTNWAITGDVFHDLVGSAFYVAPEVLRRNYGPQADIWSAGVILYILLCGVPPFWDESEQGIFEQVLKAEIDFESDPWPLISESAKCLLINMLNPNPAKRLTASEILCHPWVRVDGVAPDRPLDSTVLSRMKQFAAMNKMKKIALRVIAERLSEEEIDGLKETFKMIDADNSGEITFDELKTGLRKLGSRLMDTEVQTIMEAADIDNNGSIDYGEFIAATLQLNKIEREENLHAAFSYFDKDGSGYITVDKLHQACMEYHMSDSQIDEIIQEIDQNNDGKIDYREFTAMMRKGNGGFGRRTMRNSLNVSLRNVLGMQF